MLSERGAAKRRYHVVWTATDQIGVKFERPKRGKAAA
jgi:hypothetical protein